MNTSAATPVSKTCFADGGLTCSFSKLGDFPDRSGIIGAVWVERCSTCGLGLTKPALADVSILYADRTSQDFQPGTGGVARFIKRVAFGVQARQMLRQVALSPKRVVDFACGSGLFTRRLADCLPEGSEVIGVDFHDAPPSELGDLKYVPLAQSSELAEAADLVLAMHVVEHDDDPLALLGRIAAIAKPDGHLIIEVPHIDCVWATIFGSAWDAWYLPYHRRHFSRESLRKLVEGAGLTIIKTVDVSLPTMGRTTANLLGQRNSSIFVLLGACLHPIQLLVEKLTGQPSALRIIARKGAA